MDYIIIGLIIIGVVFVVGYFIDKNTTLKLILGIGSVVGGILAVIFTLLNSNRGKEIQNKIDKKKEDIDNQDVKIGKSKKKIKEKEEQIDNISDDIDKAEKESKTEEEKFKDMIKNNDEEIKQLEKEIYEEDGEEDTNEEKTSDNRDSVADLDNLLNKLKRRNK